MGLVEQLIFEGRISPGGEVPMPYFPARESSLRMLCCYAERSLRDTRTPPLASRGGGLPRPAQGEVTGHPALGRLLRLRRSLSGPMRLDLAVRYVV